MIRQAAWQKDQQDARHKLKTQVLNADTSRRLCAIATRTSLSCEQVLAQLDDRVRMNDDGALTVDTFTPQWLRMLCTLRAVRNCWSQVR